MSAVPRSNHDQTYLAKDYESFRQLLIAQLSTEIPDWKERQAADMTIAVLEVLAYAGDYLSYFQDAVGAEAYLETARRRISVRRHARLLDYFVDEGENARAWVRFDVSADSFELPAGTPLLTAGVGAPVRIGADAFADYTGIVFETMATKALYRQHNRMIMSTGASGLHPDCLEGELLGAYPNLKAGDVLSLSLEGPGASAAQRLIRLTQAPILTTRDGEPATQIFWLSDPATDITVAKNKIPLDRRLVCVAEGNFVLCDHGRTETQLLSPKASDWNSPFVLPTKALTHARPPPPVDAAPGAALTGHIGQVAVPAVTLLEAGNIAAALLRNGPKKIWRARKDLIASFPESRDFVVEIDDEGTPCIRFGDGINGRKAPKHVDLTATYRVGQGDEGNVGPGSLNQMVGVGAPVSAIICPFPAQGGRNPETNENIRISAPFQPNAYLSCIVAEDYATAALTNTEVQSATAQRGVGDEVRKVSIYIQRPGKAAITDSFRTRIKAYLNPYRQIGDQIEVLAAAPRKASVTCRILTTAGHASDEMLTKVELAVWLLFALSPIGGALYLSDIIETAERAAGRSVLVSLVDEDADKATDSILAAISETIVLTNVEVSSSQGDPQ